MTTINKFWAGKSWDTAALVLLLGAAVLVGGCSKQNQSVAANQPEATLAELNTALNSWFLIKGNLPASVNELTNYPALRTKRLPAPPPGKKLVLDPVTRQVVFANE